MIINNFIIASWAYFQKNHHPRWLSLAYITSSPTMLCVLDQPTTCSSLVSAAKAFSRMVDDLHLTRIPLVLCRSRCLTLLSRTTIIVGPTYVSNVLNHWWLHGRCDEQHKPSTHGVSWGKCVWLAEPQETPYTYYNVVFLGDTMYAINKGEDLTPLISH